MKQKSLFSRCGLAILLLAFFLLGEALIAGLPSNEKIAFRRAAGKYIGEFFYEPRDNDLWDERIGLRFPNGKGNVVGKVNWTRKLLEEGIITQQAVDQHGQLSAPVMGKITKASVRRGGKLIKYSGRMTVKLSIYNAYTPGFSNDSGRIKGETDIKGKKGKANTVWAGRLNSHLTSFGGKKAR